jgi:hypothetical protein
MPSPTDDTSLANRRYVTLILRLALDQKGRVIGGELVDTTNAGPEYFIKTTGLHQAVTAWLRKQRQAFRNQEQ